MGRRLTPLASIAFILQASGAAALDLRLERRIQPRPAQPPPQLVAARTPLPLRLATVLALAPRASRPQPLAPPPAPAAAARDVPAASSSGEPTLLIATVSVNDVPHGEHFVAMEPSGRFWLRREDLARIARVPEATRVRRIEGEDYVALADIGALDVRFDENRLALSWRLPPGEFPRQVFDLTSRNPAPDVRASPTSAIVNYRLSHFQSGGSSTTSASTDAALAHGDWRLLNRTSHVRSPEFTDSTRLETALVRDVPERLARWTLGDFFTPAVPLGNALQLGGLSYARSWALSPYLVRYPTVGYQGLVETPSQVDFYVGDTLILRQRVAPGPFDIRNFSYFGGRRDVRVVVRDAAGREQTYAQPFYFALEGLAAGLHDYAYQLGWIRENPTIASDEYGEAAFSAFHQYGFNDWLTLGVRTEGTRHGANAGMNAYVRTEHLGLFAVHAAGSRDRERGRDGHAANLAHSFVSGRLATYASAQRYSEHYYVPGPEPRLLLPRRDLTASIQYGDSRMGSLGLTYTDLQLHGGERRRSLQVGYNRALDRALILSAQLRHAFDDPRRSELYVGLQYRFRDGHFANTTHTADDDGRRLHTVQVGREIPRGEGFAWAVDAQHDSGRTHDQSTLAPRVRWQSPYATLGAEVVASRGDVDATQSILSAEGSLLATHGFQGFTRPIVDGFAVVRTVPPMSGVRVYENSQEVGRTGPAGEVVLTNITAYATNFAMLEQKDVPIEFVFDRLTTSFATPARSGVVLPFLVERRRSVTGRFLSRDGARPLAYVLVVVDTPRGRLELPTGERGEFYAENVARGRHAAVARLDGQDCRFHLTIPESDQELVDLGDVRTCDLP